MATTTGENHRGEGLARVLGWASVGLGLPQLVAPDRVLRFAGLRPTSQTAVLTRLVGVREMGAAAGLLTKPKQGAWLWARVAGDAMDLALLGRALRTGATRGGRARGAVAAVAGITALDVLGALQRTRAARNGGAMTTAKGAVTVKRPRSEVYRFWRELERLPQFMHHLESVRAVDERRSHWVAKAPLGRTVEWDAEITEEVPDTRIAWRSLPGADVDNQGSVTFDDAPGGRGTEVRVELGYRPPGGPLGAAVSSLFGEEPGQQVSDDLRRLKQILETGEVVRSTSAPAGTRTINQVSQEDAQPRR